jgi:fibro-slime domain-containing protein
MKYLRCLGLLPLIVALASCGGGGGGSTGGSTIGGGTGSGSQSLLTITMTGDYFSSPTTDPDFQAVETGPVTGLVQPTLGPNGFPKVSTKGQTSTYSITDVNSNGEILWWSLSGRSKTQDITAKADTLPFTFQNFFPTGQTTDSNFMRTVHWKGTITSQSAKTLTFSVFADDDLWIYIDGNLVVDDGGVKSNQAASSQNVSLAAGNHTLDIFYTDRHTTQATLGLAVTSQ